MSNYFKSPKEMMEPKFKIGDRVKEVGCTPFIVNIIIRIKGTYFYGDEIFKPKHSEDLLSKVSDKKQITLRRYILTSDIGNYQVTEWRSDHIDFSSSYGIRVVKMETKTIEVDGE